jgi:hypothetical protein
MMHTALRVQPCLVSRKSPPTRGKPHPVDRLGSKIPLCLEDHVLGKIAAGDSVAVPAQMRGEVAGAAAEVQHLGRRVDALT